MNIPQTKHFTLMLLSLSFVTCALWGGIAFSQTAGTQNPPPAIQEESTTSDDQGEVIERGIPRLPGLQRRPLAPPSAGTGQSPSHPAPPPSGGTGQSPSPLAAPPTTLANVPMPLAQHAQGQQMMATALKNASLVDFNFTFLDKTYKKDVYGPKDPFSGKRIRLSCVRLKVTSGFKLKVDIPQFTLNLQGLTVSQNISRITGNGIKIKWQLGPCFEHAGGFGVSLSDVKFVYKARPILNFDANGYCRLTWNNDPNQLRVAIGDLNIMGVQNDLDKLAKDAVREAVNLTFDAVFGAMLQKELKKVTLDVCGGLKIGNK